MNSTYTLPISVKGILLADNKVWLRKNERDEWELPGGKIDDGEQPEQTLLRELVEELGFKTEVQQLVKAIVYNIPDSLDESSGVLVLIYKVKFLEKVGTFELSGEAGKAEFKQFDLSEVADLHMPLFYKEVINTTFN